MNWIEWNWIPPIFQRYPISIGSTVLHPASWRDIWRGWKRRDWSGWVSNIRLIRQKHHFKMMIYFTEGEDALNHHGLLPDLLGSPLRGDRLALELGMGGGQEVPCTWGWSWSCSEFVLQRFCLWCASNTFDISLTPRSASTYPTFTPLSIPRSTW